MSSERILRKPHLHTRLTILRYVTNEVRKHPHTLDMSGDLRSETRFPLTGLSAPWRASKSAH